MNQICKPSFLLGGSCMNAQSQAKTSAEQKGHAACNRLIVTDGVRYGVYFKKDGVFPNEPQAYLNLTRMRDEYPLLKARAQKMLSGLCLRSGFRIRSSFRWVGRRGTQESSLNHKRPHFGCIWGTLSPSSPQILSSRQHLPVR